MRRCTTILVNIFTVDNVLYHEKTDHQDLIIFEKCGIWPRDGA